MPTATNHRRLEGLKGTVHATESAPLPSEHAAGAKKMFEMMDTDHDGSLTKAELAAGHARMMHKPAK